MNKTNEAHFFSIEVWKKDRQGAFETDEGGPQKHIFFYMALLYTIILNQINAHVLKTAQNASDINTA